jgi:Right handed beta helix region
MGKMMPSLKFRPESSKKLTIQAVLRGMVILAIVFVNFLPQKNPVYAETTSSISLYVSTTGLDSNPGTLAAPTTLEGARDKIRLLSPRPTASINVYLRGGIYERNSTFTLNRQDSGTQDAPVVYRAYPGETVRISGGKQLDPTWFSPVTKASSIWGRIDPAAKGQIMQVNLPANGITDFGTLNRRGYGQENPVSALELVFNREMMDLARWPNRGQTDQLNDNQPAIVSGNISPNVTGIYDFIGKQGQGSVDDGYPNYRRNGLINGIQYYLYHCTWTFGNLGQQTYWFISKHSPLTNPNCWPDQDLSWYGSSDQPYPFPALNPLAQTTGNAIIRTQPIDYANDGFLRIPDGINDTQFQFPGIRYQKWSQATDIWFQGLFDIYWADDTLGGSISSDGVVHLNAAPSFGIKTGQPFFVLNLLEELDIPGEWYLDRGTGILYFWPPAAMGTSEISVSLLNVTLLQVNDVSHVYFQDLTFEEGRSGLVIVTNGDDVRFTGSTFRNTGTAGLKILGTNNSVSECQIYNTGAEGVRIEGGDRASLTKSNNVVSNSEIYNFGRWERTYHPGISLYGVGNTIEHNQIHDAPHAAVLIYGNDNHIQYNEIYNVVNEANDAGAIYSGRDLGFRGNYITNNFIHHIQSVFGGSNGVYLDDAVSGFTVNGNILYDINGDGILSGGGRDNIFRNNVLVNTKGGFVTDMRALQMANYTFNSKGYPDSWNLLGRLNVDYNQLYRVSVIPLINYQHGEWAQKYPTLAVIPNNWSQVMNTHWLAPEGSVFSCNVAWNVGTLLVDDGLGGGGAFAHYAEVANNLTADPLFSNESSLDMSLQMNSPAFTLNCFKPIQFTFIGIMGSRNTSLKHLYLPLLRQ